MSDLYFLEKPRLTEVECEKIFSMNLCIYCPQRSCGKVMFLHLSVSHFVYRGSLSQHAWLSDFLNLLNFLSS